MKRHGAWLILLLSTTSFQAAAGVDDLPQFGRNMPMYPGLYFNGSWLSDSRDRSYDSSGTEHASAVPSVSEPTQFPMRAIQAEFLWHFPMFETSGLTWFSSRTHFARVQLNHVRTTTRGGLASFAAAEAGQDGDVDEADDLHSDGSGVGDLFAEYGGYIYGSPSSEWRTRERTPLAVLIAFGGNLPFGVYDRDAPVSAGSNTAHLQARLALHAQPWAGAFVDAGYGIRAYVKNQDSAYGLTAPRQQGDDQFWDLSLGQRVLSGVYLSVFASGRDGDPNQYRDIRYAANPPPASNGSDQMPKAGDYYDLGVKRTAAGIGLSWFPGQRWRLGMHYEKPLSGRSGDFLLQYQERTPAGCTPGATGCMTEDSVTVLTDAHGPARIYASTRLMLSVSYNFGLSDVFSCPGCEQ